jgi:hypothetical protein
MKNLKLTMLILLLSTVMTASAQCSFRNTAFKSGEFLTYNLYYNWKFVWVKAGSASMYTVGSNYQGKSAYRCSLTTRGTNKLDDYFVLRDTLLCYTSTNMAPLYFRKGANEGDRYTVDEVWYSYPNGKCHLRQHRKHKDGTSKWKTTNSNECIYDMMSLFMRARSFNPDGWKRGFVVKVPVADGKNTSRAILTFNGKSTVKADNGVKYRCLALTYSEWDDGEYKKIACFYVTDDKNHVPVRIDMFLKFGSAKAFLVGMKGINNPISSKVR